MDKVEAFKKEMNCYRYYLSKIKEYDERIKANFYEETGVKGISYDKIPSHPSEEALVQYRLTLIEKGESLAIERERIVKQVKHIEDVVNKMNKTLRNATIQIYIYGKTYSDVCSRDNIYWTKGGLFKAIERELNKFL